MSSFFNRTDGEELNQKANIEDVYRKTESDSLIETNMYWMNDGIRDNIERFYTYFNLRVGALEDEIRRLSSIIDELKAKE